ncbi:MAG: hypothetical protein QXU18_15450 [Thermoplasmatales archaeon]
MITSNPGSKHAKWDIFRKVLRDIVNFKNKDIFNPEMLNVKEMRERMRGETEKVINEFTQDSNGEDSKGGIL